MSKHKKIAMLAKTAQELKNFLASEKERSRVFSLQADEEIKKLSADLILGVLKEMQCDDAVLLEQIKKKYYGHQSVNASY